MINYFVLDLFILPKIVFNRIQLQLSMIVDIISNGSFVSSTYFLVNKSVADYI